MVRQRTALCDRVYLVDKPEAKEIAISADLPLRFASGPNEGSMSVFYNRLRTT
jgi:iron complex outermembrane receptor protein